MLNLVKFGSVVLDMNQFLLLAKLPKKILLASKVEMSEHVLKYEKIKIFFSFSIVSRSVDWVGH